MASNSRLLQAIADGHRQADLPEPETPAAPKSRRSKGAPTAPITPLVNEPATSPVLPKVDTSSGTTT